MMKNKAYKPVYLIAVLTLTVASLLASGLVAEEAKFWSIPFFGATAVLAYCSFAIYKWGKKPTIVEETYDRLVNEAHHIKNGFYHQKVFDLFRILEDIRLIYSRNADALLAENNIQALLRLIELYIRLVHAKIDINMGLDSQDNIKEQIHALDFNISTNVYPPEVLESKKATLQLLLKRHKTLLQRSTLNRQIDADMERIENQFHLALESGGLRPVAISSSIQLASEMMLNDMPNIETNNDGSVLTQLG